jgi:ribosomal protein S18 acetylase RimI-like enzyme
MFAELLTLDRSDPVGELLDSYPFKPYGWAGAGQTAGSLMDYMRNQIAQTVEKGGIVKTYCLGGRPIGLCAVTADDWASRELKTLTYRISHIMALGKPGAQMIVKSLLLQEALRGIPGHACTVAQIPYSDLTSINALERLGFAATQTSLLMARELADADTDVGAAGGEYDIASVDADDIDRMLDRTPVEIPNGFLGWDSGLTRSSATRVHRDWLRSYAHDHSLFLASDHGRPVGLLAEHVRTDTSPFLGFSVGSIDMVATIAEYRHNGVAGRLVTDSLRQFRSAGAGLAELTIHSADTPIAHSFQTQGFVTVGSSLTLTNWRH